MNRGMQGSPWDAKALTCLLIGRQHES